MKQRLITSFQTGLIYDTASYGCWKFRENRISPVFSLKHAWKSIYIFRHVKSRFVRAVIETVSYAVFEWFNSISRHQFLGGFPQWRTDLVYTEAIIVGSSPTFPTILRGCTRFDVVHDRECTMRRDSINPISKRQRLRNGCLSLPKVNDGRQLSSRDSINLS